MTKPTAADYGLIHQFEKTYGSLVQTPDVEMAKLWDHLGLVGRKPEEIAELYRQGYSASEISAQIHLNKKTVESKARRFGISVIPLFRLVFEIGYTRIYCNYGQAIALAMGYAKHRAITSIAAAKSGQAINLKYEGNHWFEVPDGAIYLTKTGWFVKHGLDSYESEDCRYDQAEESEAYLAEIRL